MKHRIKQGAVALLLLALVAGLCGCGASGGASAAELVVKEDLFWTTVNEVYINQKDYVGRTVRLSGLLQEYAYYDEPYFAVIRMATCCGPDDVPVGFEFVYDGEMPQLDTWVEVVGVVELKSMDGDNYPVLRATSVSATAEGKLAVSQ